MGVPTIEKVSDGMVAVTFPIQGEMRDDGFTDITVTMIPDELTWKAITRNLRSVGWSRQQSKQLAYDFFKVPEVIAIRANSVTLGPKRRAGAAE
ncbi:MAG: hypothetical protein FGM35_05470 [Rhodocyclaceae bacterium]|nr:hypothetical protein [Rhodocyclaceae bacterium]